MRRVIIFGAGVYCENRIGNIKDKVEIVAFIDNNPALWGEKRNGISIIQPDLIKKLRYDRIILMSLKSDEMKKQLLNMGIKDQKIMCYEDFYAELNKGKLEIYFDKIKNSRGKKILIALPLIGYHGNAIIALYTAKALQQKGYQVALFAEAGNREFIKSIVKEGFLVLIYGGLFCAESAEMFWIQEFDYVIVNNYQLMDFALRVSRVKPSFWWLHESKNAYINRCEKKEKHDVSELNIFAVSEVAQRNFNDYYRSVKVRRLEYGIPDTCKNMALEYNKEKLIFAIIGYVGEIKGQDILLDAMRDLRDLEKRAIEVWMIGKIGEDSFSQKIKVIAEGEPSVKLFGEFNSQEMEEAYSHIDVVVCPSRADTVPAVAVEGMMHRKICITTDVTGIAHYIEDGKNGLVCQAENVEALCEKIRWVLNNRDSLEKIGENARQTYLRYFTMERFGDKLDEIISLDEDKF